LSRIHSQAIQTDDRVLEFMSNAAQENDLMKQFLEEQVDSSWQSLKEAFSWQGLANYFEEFIRSYENRLIPNPVKSKKWAESLHPKILEQHEISLKFLKQLDDFRNNRFASGTHQLAERVKAACLHFGKCLQQWSDSVDEHIREMKTKKRTKAYTTELEEIKGLFNRKKAAMEGGRDLAVALSSTLEDGPGIHSPAGQANHRN
jgi:hypothetical protein